MHLEVSRTVKAEPETVYAAYTKFEAMPEWSRRVTSVRVTSREGDTVYLETERVSPEGTRQTREGKLRLMPPARVEEESQTRFTRTKRTVAFERASEGGTKVTAALDVQVKGLWGFVLSTRATKEEAEASALEELASFARFVERPP